MDYTYIIGNGVFFTGPFVLAVDFVSRYLEEQKKCVNNPYFPVA